MTYEQWIKMYQEDMDLLSIINNNCPFIKDNSVICNCCKLQNECDVTAICKFQPK